MNPHFLRGFAEAVLLAAALFAAWSIKANATEFFPTQQAAKIAAHGKHIAWICTEKDRLYYIGRAGEQHCGDRPRTRATARPDEDMRRVTACGDGRACADPVGNKSSATGTNSRPRPASLAGAAKPETVGVAPPTVPPPSVSLSDWQDAADTLWSFPELQEREREYRRQLLEKGKLILAQAMKEKTERLAEEAKARAAKVAEWRR